jgi:hypothetical protein
MFIKVNEYRNYSAFERNNNGKSGKSIKLVSPCQSVSNINEVCYQMINLIVMIGLLILVKLIFKLCLSET